MSAPEISIIMPVHRGEAFLQDSVRRVLDVLDNVGRPAEVLVVADGCSPSATVAQAIDDARVVALGYPDNQGKGYAICYGAAHARGRYVGWLDADLDVEPDVMAHALAKLESRDIDAVVGSKRHPDSVVRYPPSRRMLSWGFQQLVRLLFRVNVRDTQVGAKLFRRELLDTVLPLLLIKRYAFDLEVLAVGAEFGFDRIEEAPVRLHYRFSGSGIDARAVWLMLQDTLAIAYRLRVRHWYVRQYAQHQRQRGELQAGAPLGLDEIPPPPRSNLAAVRASLQ